MIRKIFVCILFLCALLIHASAQSKKNEPAKMPVTTASTPAAEQKDTLPPELKTYSNAIYFGDYDVAKNAIYNLISKYPKRIDYLDTLARIYFTMGAYNQSLAAANIVLINQPENYQLMELAAVSQNALNNNKEALALYEKLYTHSKSLDHLYQVAVQQYALKRFGECEANGDKIIADPESSKKTISFSYEEGATQEVPYAAAAYNLKGVVQKDLSQTDKAKASFEAALKIAPDFKLAKVNGENLITPPAAEEKLKEKKK